MIVNNAVLHIYPDSPCVAKCGVNLRNGRKIVFRSAMKDEVSAAAWIARVFPGTDIKVITHKLCGF